MTLTLRRLRPSATASVVSSFLLALRAACAGTRSRPAARAPYSCWRTASSGISSRVGGLRFRAGAVQSLGGGSDGLAGADDPQRARRNQHADVPLAHVELVSDLADRKQLGHHAHDVSARQGIAQISACPL